MSRARVEQMPDGELAGWREARAGAGTPLPEPTPGDTLEAVTVTVDDVQVGGALLGHGDDVGRRRCAVRVLQTTLPDDAGEHWGAVIGALEAYARARGAVVLTTAVAPRLAGIFGSAGFRATMTSMGKELAGEPTELQDDRRVSLRPMDTDERARFVEWARDHLRASMTRAGVVVAGSADLDVLDARLARLEDPPAEEVLLVGTVDGVPVGRFWGTLAESDGRAELFGNSIDLFPEHRGKRLTPSFLGAIRRDLHARGVGAVHLRVLGRDVGARTTYTGQGVTIRDVHLRKDLGHPPAG